MHYGLAPPEVCPTCHVKNAYVEVIEKEAKIILGDDVRPGAVTDREFVMRVWNEFANKNDFMLNPEAGIVAMVADGVLENEKQVGLKLCPCRLRDGTKPRDLALICPCNFKTHTTWASQNRCWCGLFVKR